jgi:hypothetical protein
MANGAVKILNFGPEQCFEVAIPKGIRPGDKLVIKDTHLLDPELGVECDIEVTVTER